MTGPWDKIRKHETDEKPLRDNGTAGSSSGGLDHAARDYNAMLQRTAVGSLSGDASLQGEGMHFNSLTAHEEGEDEISSEEPQGVIRSNFDNLHSVYPSNVRMRWNVKDLSTLSIASNLLAIFATGVLPIVDHFIWYRYDSRMTEITVTYWMAATVTGSLGIWAAYKRQAILVSLHVMLGFMLGICLGSFAISVYYDMETRCATMQAAYAGCGGCECSWKNACTKANLTQIPSCKRCQAWPVEVCRNIIVGLGNGMTLTSVMGLLALVFTSIPVTANMLLLLRMENVTGEAFKSKIGLDVVQLEHQYSLLLAGEEPTVRHSALDLLIDRVKDRGLVILADKAAAALKVHRAQRRGPNIKFKKVAKMVNAPKMGMLVSQAMRGKSLKFDRLDEDVNSLYSEISPSAHHGSQRSNTYNVSPQAVHESGSLVTGKGREVEASRVASSSDWSMSRFDGTSGHSDPDSDLDLGF